MLATRAALIGGEREFPLLCWAWRKIKKESSLQDTLLVRELLTRPPWFSLQCWEMPVLWRWPQPSPSLWLPARVAGPPLVPVSPVVL